MSCYFFGCFHLTCFHFTALCKIGDETITIFVWIVTCVWRCTIVEINGLMKETMTIKRMLEFTTARRGTNLMACDFLFRLSKFTCKILTNIRERYLQFTYKGTWVGCEWWSLVSGGRHFVAIVCDLNVTQTCERLAFLHPFFDRYSQVRLFFFISPRFIVIGLL